MFGRALHARLFLDNLRQPLLMCHGLRSRYGQRAVRVYHYPGPPQEAGGWGAVSEAYQRALRWRLPDPDPALACRQAETAHLAVGDRVRLSTPLGTHEAPLREEALHLQIERDGSGSRVQADDDGPNIAKLP